MINTTSYNKATQPIGTGYDKRPKGLRPSSLVIHTTNGQVGTLFENEAKYIFNSDSISAHFLVGKQGQIVQFLDPLVYRAWHAGVSVLEWNNARSIGIECHYAIGETWTQAQHDALSTLTADLMHQFGIPANMVETHRKIARPIGRKIDPSGFPDEQFYPWRDTLLGDTRPLWRVKPSVTAGAVIHTQSSLLSPRVGLMRASDPPFRGTLEQGGSVTLNGFGSSSTWVRCGVGCIWSNLLDRV